MFPLCVKSIAIPKITIIRIISAKIFRAEQFLLITMILKWKGNCDRTTTCRSCQDSGHIDAIRKGSPAGPGDAFRVGRRQIHQFAR